MFDGGCRVVGYVLELVRGRPQRMFVWVLGGQEGGLSTQACRPCCVPQRCVHVCM
jgi:hypothetical protein